MNERENKMEDYLEQAFWIFDKKRSKTGEERLAFKEALRSAIRSYAPEYHKKDDEK